MNWIQTSTDKHKLDGHLLGNHQPDSLTLNKDIYWSQEDEQPVEQRRPTKVFQKNKVEFYDDYAHHPTEIKSVLEAVRKVAPKRKIITVFQPHRFSRVRTLKSEFALCFKDTDQLILCPVYAAGEPIDKKYSQVKFAKLISKFSGVQVILAKDELEIIKYFKKNLINNELVIGMGAGSISKWMYNLKKNI